MKEHFPDIPTPAFKSTEQQRAVEMSLARQFNFVAVLPTGGGKSLLFTLPALAERKQHPPPKTFVIVPNKALLDDHLVKARSVGLNAIQWSSVSKRLSDDEQLIFVALETAASQGFMKLWSEQEGHVVRLVIDEAHQMLTQRSFRDKFEKLS
ncbi:P-loop containing nucleoside triphosphate hydrolase protein, partial [Agrocybe pediades]